MYCQHCIVIIWDVVATHERTYQVFGLAGQKSRTEKRLVDPLLCTVRQCETFLFCWIHLEIHVEIHVDLDLQILQTENTEILRDAAFSCLFHSFSPWRCALDFSRKVELPVPVNCSWLWRLGSAQLQFFTKAQQHCHGLQVVDVGTAVDVCRVGTAWVGPGIWSGSQLLPLDLSTLGTTCTKLVRYMNYIEL